MDTRLLAEQSIEAVRGAAQELSRLKGWNMKSVKGFISCLPVVVKHVEQVAPAAGLDGPGKQQLAVEIILKLLPLPFWVPRSLVRPLLEGAINAVVEAIKQRA